MTSYFPAISGHSDLFRLSELGLDESVTLTMADTGSEITGQEGNDDNPPVNPPPAPPVPMISVPAQTFQDLTEAINNMREELILHRARGGNQPPAPPNPPAPQVRNIRSSSLNYYPDIDKLCRHLYLDNPDPMEAKSALEWLKSLHTLASILRCDWILADPPTPPPDVNDGEKHQITVALMANFRRKIPAELKVSLPINVDDETVTPSSAYNSLLAHFSKPDPYVHEKLRLQVEARNIGKNEKISKYMKWHRELRAQMIDAKYPEITDEKITIKWVVRGLSNHIQYSPLASSWRASDPPASLSELEAILASEEAEMERNRRLDGQMQALLKQVNRRPTTQYNQQQQNPPQNAPYNQQQQRGRGRGRGGRGRGRGKHAPPKQEANANLAQQMEEMAAELAAMKEAVTNPNPNNNNNAQDGQRRVNFDDNVNDFVEAVAEQDDDHDDDAQEQFQQGKFLLDTAAYPSHVHSPATTTNPLPSPILVSTPNGPYSVNESANVTLPLPSGQMHTKALVNRSMTSNLISPSPIICQHGPILLTKTAAAVLPPHHPITARVTGIAEQIATVRNGVYILHTNSNKTPSSAHRAISVPIPKSKKRHSNRDQ